MGAPTSSHAVQLDGIDIFWCSPPHVMDVHMPEVVAAENMKQTERMTQAMHKGPSRGQDPAGGPRGQCRGDLFPRGSSFSHSGSFVCDLCHKDRQF